MPETQELLTPRIPDTHLRESAEVIKCLGHPLRLRLLEELERGERSVTELQEYSGASQAAVSQQLGILKGRGVVDSRRDGVYVYYRVVEPKVYKILACIRDSIPSGDPF